MNEILPEGSTLFCFCRGQGGSRGLLQMHKQTSIILILIIIERPYQSRFKFFLFSSTNHSRNTYSSNFKIKRGWQKQQFRIGVVWNWELLCDGVELSSNHNLTSNMGVSPQPDILQGRHWNKIIQKIWIQLGIVSLFEGNMVLVHVIPF